MLELIIPLGPEEWDEQKEEFIVPETRKLKLEHSLSSIALWESKWRKPFFSNEPKTLEESLDYIKCMTLNDDIEPEIYDHITNADQEKIAKYIDEPKTATTFNENGKGKKSREIITSEIIYYWMIQANVPPEYANWHIDRLITLLRVCNIKNAPAKKMSKKEIMSRNAALNAARRNQLNSKG